VAPRDPQVPAPHAAWALARARGRAPAADIDPATGKPRLYGGYYSQDTVRALVAYAAERAITIVPEIDLPGHASAAVAAYPRLAAIANPSPDVPADWGVYPNVYNADESTFAFLEDVMREVMDLFPSPYIHVGGDEVEKSQWRDSPAVRERARALGIEDPAKLQGYFTQRMARFLQDNGRRLVGWDEILEPGLAQNAVVMSWRGIEGGARRGRQGPRHRARRASHALLRQRAGVRAGEPPGRGRVISLRTCTTSSRCPRRSLRSSAATCWACRATSGPSTSAPRRAWRG
jgi:hexosaminidase